MGSGFWSEVRGGCSLVCIKDDVGRMQEEKSDGFLFDLVGVWFF